MKKILIIGLLLGLIMLVGCSETNNPKEESCIYPICNCQKTCLVLGGEYLKYEPSHWGTPSKCSCLVDKEIIVI